MTHNLYVSQEYTRIIIYVYCVYILVFSPPPHRPRRYNFSEIHEPMSHGYILFVYYQTVTIDNSK